MELFTEEQYQKLLENGKPENRHLDNVPVVKIFMPETNCVWLISEIYTDYSYLAFALCDLGQNYPDVNFIDLRDFIIYQSPFGGRVQRDADFTGLYPMATYYTAARVCDRITEKEQLLKKCYITSFYLENIHE